MARRRGRIGLAVAGVALVIAGGCGSDEGADTADTSDSGASTIPLEGTNWVLAGDELGEPLGDTAVSALFSEGTVAGQGGCNRYTGPYDVEGDALTIGPEIASTQIACGPAETAVERAYLDRLPRVASYAIEGTALTLSDGDGEVLLAYEASIGAEAIIGDWTVTSYYSGNAVTSVLGDVTLTANFTESEVSGNAGCNNFTGPYSVDGDSIAIGPLATTRKACESEEISKQETDYLAALDLATTFMVTGTRLDLLRDGGTIAVTLEKA